VVNGSGRELTVSEAFVTEALDVERFIARRNLPGGPAPETTRTAIDTARERLAEDQETLDSLAARVQAAKDERSAMAARLLGHAPSSGV